MSVDLTLDRLNDVLEVEKYFDYLLSMVIVDADKILYEKYLRARGKSSFTRKRVGKSIARIRGYIIPSDVIVVSETNIPITPCIVTNPAIEIHNSMIYIYLRLASIGSVFSRTFISVAKLKPENLSGRIKVKAYPILYGIMPYECVEDPRVDPDKNLSLYHVRAIYRTEISRVFTFHSQLTDYRVDKIEAINFYSKEWGTFLIQDYRDTFPLNNSFMIVRPFFKDKGFGVIAIGPRHGVQVDFDELEVPPELLPSTDEVKAGGNATLRLSNNEYLLLYHIVDDHGVYYTYGALFDRDAELLALTEEPIIAPEAGVYSGRRPSTVFVCGATLYGDSIIISAGRDDEITLIYEIGKQEIYDSLKYVSG